MFYSSSSAGFRNVLSGITMKTLVFGKKTLLVEFRLKKGSALPFHSHPHEQTGCCVKGSIRLTIGKASRVMRPGDCWCISGNAAHGASALKNAVAVEVFSPVRKNYLPEKKSRRGRAAASAS